MSDEMRAPPERQVITTYDAPVHCTAERRPDANTVPMDYPYTGKGEEFFPTNLQVSGLIAQASVPGDA